MGDSARTGLAGPIALLYLGFFASVAVIGSVARGLFEPRMDWAGIGLGGAFVFALIVIAGISACVSAVRMLADSPRFPARVAPPNSSIGRKVDSYGTTAIAFAIRVVAFTGHVPWLGLLAPIIAGWACANTIRIYRTVGAS
ncbi:hypothetical protein [Rhodococcus sp. MALMAid1271]|uniref:hypothetical protein n=1 Tax=Rhodococcus sp. MALMAid1271 TaxID=3411744 RepID=UPI003BA3DFD2